jgi:amidophosphoribosyltransferase
MAAKQDLVASGRSLEEIKDFLGCDNLVYQDLEDLVSSVMELNPELDGVEKSIFDGEYPTNISDEYLDTLEKARSMANL